MPTPCYHADTPLIPAHYQPALVLEHARGLDLNSHVLLRHSGLFEEDFASEARALSPAQLLAMLANLAQHDAARDAAFQLGQQMLPGHYGAASLALMQSPDLGSALRLLVAHQAQLCPLLAPRLGRDGVEDDLAVDRRGEAHLRGPGDAEEVAGEEARDGAGELGDALLGERGEHVGEDGLAEARPRIAPTPARSSACAPSPSRTRRRGPARYARS